MAQGKGSLTSDTEAPGRVLHPLTREVQPSSVADNWHPVSSLQSSILEPLWKAAACLHSLCLAAMTDTIMTNLT